jgi:hypothetical protein
MVAILILAVVIVGGYLGDRLADYLGVLSSRR